MSRIYMIRHGHARAGWDSDPDPGLDELGRAQAAAVAKVVTELTGSARPILTSPLKRCQETAMPLAMQWQVKPEIEPRVSEIPPPFEDLAERTVWLRRVMSGSWEALYDDRQSIGDDYRGWYDDVVAAVVGQKRDVVIFSHFIALNVAYCAATGASDVVSFRPDNASLTIFETNGQKLSLVEKGREAETLVAPGKA